MNTNIYLIRHAHSQYSIDELNRTLSPRGYGDAKKVTEVLAKENIDFVYSSPYKRAIETVEGVANYFNNKIIIDARFKERVLSLGEVKDFDSTILRVWQDFEYHLDGGESGYVAQKRGVQAIEDILLKHQGKNIAIGTHGNIMVLIMNYYNKKYGYSFWKALKMPDVYKLTFINNKLYNVKSLLNMK